MSTSRKARFIQAAVGAVVLTALMQPVILLGYLNFVWVLFLPLLLFFALGADPRKVPSMLACFVCGQLWGVVNGVVQGGLGAVLPAALAGVLAAVLVIFAMLTVHENLLAGTLFGNVPALFMGMALTFFITLIEPAEGPSVNPLQLLALFGYGIVLAVVMVLAGGGACTALLGKDWAEPDAPAQSAQAM